MGTPERPVAVPRTDDPKEIRKWREVVTWWLTQAYSGVVFPEWWGAKGDGATDDSAAINLAINYLVDNKNGGVVQFLGKNYVCNIDLPENAHNIVLRGIVPVNWHIGLGDFGGTKLTAAASGDIIGTPSSSPLYNVTIENFWFYGLGSGTPCVGIRFDSVTDSMVRDCSFDNLADQAIYLENTCISNHFERLKALHCLLNTTRQQHDGVIQVGDSDSFYVADNYFTNCEIAPALSSNSDGDLYVDAWAIYGSLNFLNGCIGEYSDIGFWIDGYWNKFSMCRADLNYGHGWELTDTAQHNQFGTCHALRNSWGNDNLYDGFHVGNNGNNTFTNCGSQSLATEDQQRYGFYDGVSSSSAKNIYNGCYGDNNQTAIFGSVELLGSYFSLQAGWRYFTDDDATPSVDAGDFFIFNAYTQATDITDFLNGSDGKVIRVIDWSMTGYITIKNNANIVTTTSSDVSMVQNKIYSFVKLNGVWRGF